MQATPIEKYKPETAGSIMSTNVPTCHPSETLGEVLVRITARAWDSIHNVYVVDNDNNLLGYIDIAMLQADHEVKVETLVRSAGKALHTGADQEKAVFMAVNEDVITVPVVDDVGHFLGAITPHAIIDVMHNEHVEDALLTAGIRHGKGIQIAKLATERTGLLVKTRVPWLIGGLVAGLGLGVISSLFEKSLQQTVALAYFIPVVAYIADSIGTQTEAIAIRALAVIKVSYWRYIFKELLVGMALGVIVGVLGGLGAAVIGKSARIGLVVALSLVVASTLATMIASSIPIMFKLLGKDPALGSGPLATAIQDIISVLVYFLFAVMLL